MQEIGNKIKNVPDTIIDESFHHRERSDFDLFLYFDQESIVLSAWSSADHTLTALEIIPTSGISDLADTVRLSDLLNNSVLGKDVTGYHHRILFSGIRNATLTPNALFLANEVRLQHSFSVPISDNSKEFTDELRIADARTIYSVPKDLEANFSRVIGQYDLFHSSTAFIESQLLKNRNRSEQNCSVIIHSQYFELLVTNGKQLLLYNTFDIENNDSVLYYLLFCCEQLDLNPETLLLELSGSIDNTSTIYSTLSDYFRNISFGEGPNEIKLSYRFYESPVHHYYPVLNFQACV
jgi:hypothetical protein